jgi:hypothetical protein
MYSRHPLHGASRRALARKTIKGIRARQKARADVADQRARDLVNNQARIASLKAQGARLPGQPVEKSTATRRT